MSMDLYCDEASSDWVKIITDPDAKQVFPSDGRIVEGPALGPLGIPTIQLERQDWDVQDPAEREAYGRKLVGDQAYEAHCGQVTAQWFINVKLNAIALVVYRQPVLKVAA